MKKTFLIFVFLLTGCSFYGLIGKNLDYILSDNIEEKLYLNGDQEDELEKDIKKFLNSRQGCYIEYPKNELALLRFLHQDARRSEKMQTPLITHIVLNNDRVNRNLKNDCFSLPRRAQTIGKHLNKLADKIYQGEFLTAYEFDYQRIEKRFKELKNAPRKARLVQN